MNFKGMLPLLILHYLTAQPMHGYGLGKLIKEGSKGAIEFKEGSLYLTLSRMEEDGFITAEKREQGGRLAVYFTLTDLGIELYKDRLNEWMIYRDAINNILGDHILQLKR